MSTMSQRVRPRAGVTQELVGQELFLSSGGGAAAVHCLNGGAAIIWYLCDGTRDLAGVADELVAQYGVAPDAAQRDVRDVVSKLQALELLEHV